jgi:hypothetical protein
MCLDMLYELPPPRWGVGYKVVQKTKQAGKYLCLYFPVAIYKNRWVTDPAPPDILQTPCPADIPQYYPGASMSFEASRPFLKFSTCSR